MRKFLNLLVCLLPWPLRRWVLIRAYGYKIAADARIGWAYVFPRHLEMGPASRIGHLSVIMGAEAVILGEHASIGRLNWISAYPKGPGRHFAAEPERDPRLIVGAHAAITNRHLIDCSNRVEIGAFSTFAGFRSQILTHSIDLMASRQATKPVTIGEYCFVGTGCILLPGAALPARSVLAAGSTLITPENIPGALYTGAPAKFKKALSENAAYFTRPEGYVW